MAPARHAGWIRAFNSMEITHNNPMIHNGLIIFACFFSDVKTRAWQTVYKTLWTGKWSLDFLLGGECHQLYHATAKWTKIAFLHICQGSLIITLGLNKVKHRVKHPGIRTSSLEVSLGSCAMKQWFCSNKWGLIWQFQPAGSSSTRF